jgi:hypothetical protein
VGNTHKTNQQKWRERRQHIDFWKHIITLWEFHNREALRGRRKSTGFKSASPSKIWKSSTTRTKSYQPPYSLFSAICATVCWLYQTEMRFLWTIYKWHYGPGVDSASNRNEYQESSCG